VKLRTSRMIDTIISIGSRAPTEFLQNSIAFFLQNSICIDCSCTEFESDLQGISVSWFMIHVSWFSFARSFYFLFNANDFFAWQCVRHARRVWCPLRMQRSGLLVWCSMMLYLHRGCTLEHARVLLFKAVFAVPGFWSHSKSQTGQLTRDIFLYDSIPID